ncbi:tetratricopeptide repeat protein [bacterium]|nr:tetratricopeptide repeat protein [bacterium]
MSDTQTAQQVFARARQCLKKGDLDQAIRLLSVLEHEGHNAPKVLEALAVAQSLTGEHEVAIETLERCLQKQPDRISTLVNLGAVCNRMHDYRRAIEWLNQAIRIDWRSTEAYYNLGVAWLKLKDFGQAKQMLQEAIRLQPDMIEAWYNLGLVFQKSGNVQLAASWYRKVLAEKPRHEKARRGLKEAEACLEEIHSPASFLDRLGPQEAESIAADRRPLTHHDLESLRSCGLEIGEAAKQLGEWFDAPAESLVRQVRRQITSIRASKACFDFRNDLAIELASANTLLRRLEAACERLQRQQSQNTLD